VAQRYFIAVNSDVIHPVDGDEELDGMLAELPAVAVEGPRGTGKTATAGHREKPAKTTRMPYRDALERLWIVVPAALLGV
jgi:hypothetical protein